MKTNNFFSSESAFKWAFFVSLQISRLSIKRITFLRFYLPHFYFFTHTGRVRESSFEQMCLVKTEWLKCVVLQMSDKWASWFLKNQWSWTFCKHLTGFPRDLTAVSGPNWVCALPHAWNVKDGQDSSDKCMCTLQRSATWSRHFDHWGQLIRGQRSTTKY